MTSRVCDGSCACMTRVRHQRWGTSGVRRQTSRAAGVATRPAGSSVLCGDALDGDAEAAGLVDEVVGDAAAWERDDALGQE